MYPTPMTLAEFFKARSGRDIVFEALKSAERTQLKGIPGLGWDLVKRKFDNAYQNMLDVKMVDVFCDALILLQEFQIYHSRDKYLPGKVSHKTLAELTIRSEHHPKLELLFEQKRIADLTFDVNLELKLEGFVLKIQNAHIREIAAGTYQGVGTIACRGQELVSESTPKYQLPGNIVLEPGIQIPRQKEPKPLQHSKLRRSSVDAGNYSQSRLEQPIAWLIGIEGHARGQRYPVDKARYRIGSKTDNDLCIKGDDYVSSNHAYLSYQKGSLFLFDQDSSNGTFLNEEEVTRWPIVVQRGDHIRLGESIFMIQ